MDPYPTLSPLCYILGLRRVEGLGHQVFQQRSVFTGHVAPGQWTPELCATDDLCLHAAHAVHLHLCLLLGFTPNYHLLQKPPPPKKKKI